MSQAEALAREVLLLSRNTLPVHLRFPDAALSQFAFTPAPLPFATDGQELYYDPRHVLLRYKEEKEQAVRDYLHLVMHCVFRHMYVQSLREKPLWDPACDVAVDGRRFVTARGWSELSDMIRLCEQHECGFPRILWTYGGKKCYPNSNGDFQTTCLGNCRDNLPLRLLYL